MGKIVFLDVDGTLVDYENRLPESAVRAIRKVRENGHRIYICTGRSKAEMYSELWDIGLDGYQQRGRGWVISCFCKAGADKGGIKKEIYEWQSYQTTI